MSVPGMIIRNFKWITVHDFKILYNSYVWPHLEFVTLLSSWHHTTGKDPKKSNKVSARIEEHSISGQAEEWRHLDSTLLNVDIYKATWLRCTRSLHATKTSITDSSLLWRSLTTTPGVTACGTSEDSRALSCVLCVIIKSAILILFTFKLETEFVCVAFNLILLTYLLVLVSFQCASRRFLNMLMLLYYLLSRSKLRVRQKFFSQRSVNDLNRLPKTVVDATSVNMATK